MFPLLISICLLMFPSILFAQLAPAGIAFAQSGQQVYLFGASGTYHGGSSFIYLDYSTGQIDSLQPNVSADGSFSGTSAVTGRTLSGQIGASAVTLTYNGFTVSAPKLSSYGPTGKFAGTWTGFISDNTFGIGYAQAIITSQGQMFAIAAQSSLDAGVGTIDTSGHFTVQLLSGLSINGTFNPSFGSASGTYSVSSGAVESYGLVRSVPSRLANLSTRGLVGSGEQVLIGGFIVDDGGKTVFMDAKGPSLGSAGVANPVQATKIDLYLGSQIIASNNGWRNNANVAEIQASGLAPSNDHESALQVALEPGAYTVVVSSGDASTGIGLVEVFGVGNTGGP